MSLRGSIFFENWTTKFVNYSGKLHKLSLWWMSLPINGTHAGERDSIQVLLWHAREGQAFFMEEITINHNGENELPWRVWNPGWLKMLNSHNTSDASINNLVYADVRSRYWDNTPKTAQADMFCQNKEDISVSFNFLPILTYSSNDQNAPKGT